MPSDIEIKTTQSTTVECPVPSTPEQAKQFGHAIAEAAAMGQGIASARLFERGQRDPITTAVLVVLRSA